jgi:sigma-B regulation protein RsbU (phosphoserine phosphatase)
MLRADAVSLALGGLLLVVGLLALVLWTGARRRAASLRQSSGGGVWLSVFAFLYGARLLARTRTIRLGFDVAPAVWDYAAAAITYTIPLPLVLFVRAFWPAWRRLSTFGAVGLVVFATYAIASDAILHRPDSARTPNNAIAVAFLGALLALAFWPGLTPSRELRTARIGLLAWSLTAVADNLRGMKALAFPGPDLEPFGFIVLMASLVTMAVWRVIGEARRLVAIDRELSVARQIQSSILPQAMPRLSRVTLAARYRPLAAVAGDFYDFLEVDEQRLGVLVADVCGHGVPAALIASMVKVALAAQQARADRPAAVLTRMNEALCGRLGGQYVTAAYLFIDARSGLIRYAAAGHPPMLCLSQGDREVREVEKNGLILGFASATDYEELEQPLESGDRLLLYTDGLVEAENAADEFFGLERVKTGLAAGAALPPEAALDALLNTMDVWSGRPAGDDLTTVLVDWGRPDQLH